MLPMAARQKNVDRCRVGQLVNHASALTAATSDATHETTTDVR